MNHLLERNLVIARVMPEPEGGISPIYLRQESHLMADVQDYYMHELNLARVDPDPAPNPDDPAEQLLRASYMTDLGGIHTTGLARYGIFERDLRTTEGEINISESDSALVAMIILAKQKDNGGTRKLCAADQHTPTEIVEWNVHSKWRSQGLGRDILAFALADVHDEDTVVLDVARENKRANEIYYKKLGFKYTDVEYNHGVFDTTHHQMSTTTERLRAKLGVDMVS